MKCLGRDARGQAKQVLGRAHPSGRPSGKCWSRIMKGLAGVFSSPVQICKLGIWRVAERRNVSILLLSSSDDP